MENGKIYKYTNLINGKIYIGQTKQTLEQRDYKHQTQLNDNTYFHRAIKKYGRKNFSLELIEDNNLYRGQQWYNQLKKFRGLKTQVANVSEDDLEDSEDYSYTYKE